MCHGADDMKVSEDTAKDTKYGVWLSLARALDLGSRGRRFESCHPDLLEFDFEVNDSIRQRKQITNTFRLKLTKYLSIMLKVR